MTTLHWRHSSRCGSEACIEVATTDSYVYVRDSRNDQRLQFSHAEWQAFLDGVHSHEFELSDRTPTVTP